MRQRSFLHRLVAVLCGVLVLQLALLGPAAACTVPAMAQGSAHAMGDMAGAATPGSRHEQPGRDESCRLPLSATQCVTVACATVVLAPALAAATTSATWTPPARIVAEPLALESGNRTAPELPPPRA
jgi:hypothetical protein